MKAVELFCGIGGFASAVSSRVEIVAAVDIDTRALQVCARNHTHPLTCATIESLSLDQMRKWSADFWWLSPPCQPYTRRGAQRDIDDPRAQSLCWLLDRVRLFRPPYLALENVPPFRESRMYARVLSVLDQCGYEIHEHLLCPSQLGVPNRRLRFYMVAGRDRILPQREEPSDSLRIQDVIEYPAADELTVSPALLDQYSQALHVVDADDPQAISHCFTSAYGRSLVRSGSYLRTAGRVRRFSPTEILQLLGFPASFSFPPDLSLRQRWQLAGNSLSLPAVRSVLSTIP